METQPRVREETAPEIGGSEMNPGTVTGTVTKVSKEKIPPPAPVLIVRQRRVVAGAAVAAVDGVAEGVMVVTMT